MCKSMKRNYAKEFKELVEKEGYKLLSEYKGALKKVKLTCDKEHIYEVIPISFKSGFRCPKCSSHCPIQAKEQFIELLNKEGYELISEYKNVRTKVKIKCPKGHVYDVKPSDFKNSGNRCLKCANKCPIQAKKEFIELLDQEGYKLLSEYKKALIKVKIKCNKGHIYKVTPNSFKNGSRCPKCINNCPIQAKEQFVILVKQEGYKLLSKYKNNNTKVKLKCPEGHIWYVRSSDFKNFIRCPHCKGSSGQRLLQKMLKEHIQDNVIYNDREALNGLELDIYYPELNIAIEYQGNYWHSLQKTNINDKRKRKLCEEKGIKLIEVWDDDFIKNPDKITKFIHNKITRLMSR